MSRQVSGVARSCNKNATTESSFLWVILAAVPFQCRPWATCPRIRQSKGQRGSLQACVQNNPCMTAAWISMFSTWNCFRPCRRRSLLPQILYLEILMISFCFAYPCLVSRFWHISRNCRQMLQLHSCPKQPALHQHRMRTQRHIPGQLNRGGIIR